MAKIIGNTTATPNPKPDWNQIDETKADYIKNKPIILTETDVQRIVAGFDVNTGGGSFIVSIVDGVLKLERIVPDDTPPAEE